MVDVSLATPKLALSEQPKSDVTSAVFNRPAPVSIAPGLEQLGQGAEDLATNLARAQGQADAAKLANASSPDAAPGTPGATPGAAPAGASPTDPSKMEVTLDASGKPQVATPLNSVILGRAGDAYQAAMLQGGRAALQSKLNQDVADGHAKFETDPQGFLAYAKAKADAYRSMYPGELGTSLADEVNNLAGQHYGNIVENNITRTTRENLQAIQTNIDDTTNTMKALARQGAINTPQYDQLQDRLQDGYDSLGSNPLFGYSQDKIDSLQAHATSEMNGEYVVGRIDDTYNRKGKAAALDVIKTQIDNNPDLQVDDATRNQLHNYALSRLSYLSQEQQSDLAALKPTVDLQIKAFQSGNTGPGAVSDQEVDQTLSQLRGLGAFKEASDLEMTRIVADRTVAFRNLSPAQKSNVLLSAAGAGVGGPIASGVNTEQGALQFFQSKGWSPVQASAIVGNLVHESGGRLNTAALNPGDGSDGSDSIGIGQWNGQRAANLKAFAAAQGKPVTDLGTQLGFVQRELETSESAAAQRLKGATTTHDAAAAFALGYERPQGFQSGVAENVLGWQNRLDQTNRLAAGGGSSTTIPDPSSPTPGITTLGQPFTDAEAQADPWLRTAYRQQIQIDDGTQIRFAKSQFEAIDNSIKYTGTVSPDIVNHAATVLQIADRFPDQLGSQAEALRGALAGRPAGFAAAGSPDQGANLLAQTEELARHGDPLGNAVYKNAKEGIEQGKKLLADDQFEYARQAGWLPRKPMPLNWTDPVALQQSMAEHGVAAAKIAGQQGLPGVSAFTPAETSQVKGILTDGTPDQRVAVLSAITGANMSPAVLKATLGSLGKDETTAPLAIAGDVARFNPDVARGIVQGQALMQTDKNLAPNKDDFPSAFSKVLPFNDLGGPIRKGYDSAIQALYARRSAAANDASGVLNEERLGKAIDDVTGGVVEWRGGKAIAPWYGATQEQFEAAKNLVTDADLANARGSDGVPLPAAALRPSLAGVLSTDGSRWRLQSYGEGKYTIYSGPDDARQYLRDARDTSGKSYFILDLGAKRAAVEENANLAMPSGLFHLPQYHWYDAPSPTETP